jgi:hypothetical protein
MVQPELIDRSFSLLIRWAASRVTEISLQDRRKEAKVLSADVNSKSSPQQIEACESFGLLSFLERS